MNTLVIIVNFRLTEMTLQAVQTVKSSASAGRLQVVVVDNSEDNFVSEKLCRALPADVDLVVPERNLGFGRACDLVFKRYPEKYVLLLNPDAKLLPGSLTYLQKALLGNKKAAAVGPQIYWDNRLRFLLPPSLPPAYFCFAELFGLWGSGGRIVNLLSRIRRFQQIRIWRSSIPLKVPNLSGGHVLLKRSAVENAGELFDPKFFLYFEDTDLFVRLRKAGYDLLVEPRAKVIHFYDQCAIQDHNAKRMHMEKSQRIFREKNCRGWKSFIPRIVAALHWGSNSAKSNVSSHQYEKPFTMKIPEKLHKGWLFEWSPNQNFIPTVGLFGKGSKLIFPEKCWAMLAPGTYYGRLGSRHRLSRFYRYISWIVR